MNVDGVVVYTGSLTSSTKTFQFTCIPVCTVLCVVNYLVNSGSSLYIFQSYETAAWWQRDYIMTSDWTLVSSTSTAREVEGTNLNRISFNIPNLEKYSHIVVRLYYKYGIIFFINGVRYYYDNVQLYQSPFPIIVACSLKRIILIRSWRVRLKPTQIMSGRSMSSFFSSS